MLASQAAKWCTQDPLRKKFTKEEKAQWTKAERGLYKSAYELGGEARATAVMRRHFAEKEEKERANGEEPEANDGAPAAADDKGSAEPVSAEPPARRRPSGGDTSPSGHGAASGQADAVEQTEVATIAPPALAERPEGELLMAGSTNWEEVGKRSLTTEEAAMLTSFCRLSPGRRFSLVVTGPSACHVVAVAADGTAFAWGRNATGQLGLGHTRPVSHPSPLVLPGGGSVRAAACGKAHTLLITGEGAVLSCGSNSYAQLGTGAQAKIGAVVARPTRVAFPAWAAPAVRLACGADFSIAVDADGRVWSWGHPQYGQLGHGTNGEFLERAGKIDYQFRTEPGPVTLPAPDGGGSNPPKAGPVACGDHHTVLCTTLGVCYTWGFGGYGRLGHSDQSDQLSPKVVAFQHKAKIRDVSAGGTCCYAVGSSGAVFFWGRTKSTGEATMYPKAVPDLSGWAVRSVACGHTSTVVAADDSLISWGPSPAYGELGYGESGPRSSTAPKLVDELQGARVEMATAGFACSVLLCSDASDKSRAVLHKLGEHVGPADDPAAATPPAAGAPEADTPAGEGNAKAGAKRGAAAAGGRAKRTRK